MTPTAEKKILEKLNRIERLLIKVIPTHSELTEEEVLAIVDAGNEEQRRGNTVALEQLLETKYPHLQK